MATLAQRKPETVLHLYADIEASAREIVGYPDASIQIKNGLSTLLQELEPLTPEDVRLATDSFLRMAMVMNCLSDLTLQYILSLSLPESTDGVHPETEK